MSAPRRRRPQARRTGRAPGTEQVELWRRLPPLPEPEPVVPMEDPTALLRSLGDPSLPGNSVAASHYLASVIERAAMLATGLAAASGLLTEPEPTEHD
jgi:hypothetical protein